MRAILSKNIKRSHISPYQLNHSNYTAHWETNSLIEKIATPLISNPKLIMKNMIKNLDCTSNNTFIAI